MTTKFDDRAFRAALQRRIAGALDEQGAEMADQAKAAVGRANAGTPSEAGEPPRLVTGRLQASIAHEVETDANSVTLRVGSGDRKAKHLEVGTSSMAARPFLRPTLQETIKRLVAAVSAATGRR